jgi:pimeloyl-ACP methyl ester carboxylesterase
MLKKRIRGKDIVPKSFLVIILSVFTILILKSELVIAKESNDKKSPPGQSCDREPTGIDISDYLLDFQTENMPDPNLDGLTAEMRVHRVRPVYANGKCKGVPNLAVVLVHGRSAPGSPSFDLRHPTVEDPDGGAISLQETLARAGIESFAPDLIGYGGSSRLVMDDHCNASLPAYVAPNPDGTCPATAPFLFPQGCCPVAQGCDRTRNANVFPLNQQANHPVGLGVNPGEPLCSHSSSIYFANPDVFARNIMQVIDDAIAKAQPRGNKITALLGYSFGGPSVARTLYLLGEEAEHKIRRVVFMASLFNLLPGPGGVPIEFNLPTEEEDLPPNELSTSFPLALNALGGWSGVGSVARNNFCTGRIISNVPAEFAQQILDLDPLGTSWGGSVSGNPTGLLRSPTFTLYGWNHEVAATFTLPTLVMHGADDVTSPTPNSNNIYNALTSVNNKVLVQVECGSHQFIGEGCSGTRCDDQNPNTTPYGQDSQVWAGPYSTVAEALIEWIKFGTFNHSACGSFNINPSGVISSETPCQET